MLEKNYISNVIKKGDKISRMLSRIFEPTLENSGCVEIISHGVNGLSVLRPEDNYIFVHSAGGNHREKRLDMYAKSLVRKLVEQAVKLDVKPVAFSDIIDSSKADEGIIKMVAGSLADEANNYRLSVMNGEYAVLGDRVNNNINITGTMISIAKESHPIIQDIIKKQGWLKDGFAGYYDGINYAVFNPKGKAVFINSDGVGTKTDFYERTKKYEFAIDDSLAMKLDDAVRLFADVKVFSDVVETKGYIPFPLLEGYAFNKGLELNILCILQHERIEERLKGYSKDCYNLSGSVVSVIDESFLRNPLKPSPGNIIIALKGRANPRSNGITDKRKAMTILFGEDYEKKDDSKEFLDYLTEPSIIFYPFVRELIKNNLVTGFYHMSGGAYEGKLARPLAKHNLFVELDNLFEPDYREIKLAQTLNTSTRDAYAKWPMGNDAFIITRNNEQVEQVQNIARCYNLESRIVGTLREAVHGETGVRLNAFNKKIVYFSGNNMED